MIPPPGSATASPASSPSTIIPARRSAPASSRLAATRRGSTSIINSHFHFDHCGGNAQIPNATLVVQRREWDSGMDPDIGRPARLQPARFRSRPQAAPVDGEHDVFGDGSVVCLPTHGHTPGHQSLKLRLAGGDIVLAADSCYFCRTLRERRLPRFAHDRDADARLARPPRRARKAGRAHLFWPRPGILGEPCRRRRRRSGDTGETRRWIFPIVMAGSCPAMTTREVEISRRWHDKRRSGGDFRHLACAWRDASDSGTGYGFMIVPVKGTIPALSGGALPVLPRYERPRCGGCKRRHYDDWRLSAVSSQSVHEQIEDGMGNAKTIARLRAIFPILTKIGPGMLANRGCGFRH